MNIHYAWPISFRTRQRSLTAASTRLNVIKTRYLALLPMARKYMSIFFPAASLTFNNIAMSRPAHMLVDEVRGLGTSTYISEIMSLIAKVGMARDLAATSYRATKMRLPMRSMRPIKNQSIIKCISHDRHLKAMRCCADFNATI